jgi:hypothetical protein
LLFGITDASLWDPDLERDDDLERDREDDPDLDLDLDVDLDLDLDLDEEYDLVVRLRDLLVWLALRLLLEDLEDLEVARPLRGDRFSVLADCADSRTARLSVLS